MANKLRNGFVGVGALLVLLLKVVDVASAGEQGPNLGEVNKKLSGVSIPWVANQGQFDASVKYAAKTFAGPVFVTDDEISYSIFKGEKNEPKLGQAGQDRASMIPPPPELRKVC